MQGLIVVDVQNDFLPGGALAVPDGDEVTATAARLVKWFPVCVATQDWHPADHGSFAVNHVGATPGQVITLHGLPQMLWPTHCVQGTWGAEFGPGIDPMWFEKIFTKGTDPTVDSYSGFFDNGRRKSTGLAEYLRQRRVDQVFVMGLATDYCVKATALDACGEGFETTLIVDACRGVELQPGDCRRAVEEMAAAGVHVRTSSEIEEERKRTGGAKV